MTPSRARLSDNIRAELVIIGGGGAGLAAAAAAAERGAHNVILLEKRGTLGGNTAMAVGLLGIESPVQKRAAIDYKSTDDSRIAFPMSIIHDLLEDLILVDPG